MSFLGVWNLQMLEYHKWNGIGRTWEYTLFQMEEQDRRLVIHSIQMTWKQPGNKCPWVHVILTLPQIFIHNYELLSRTCPRAAPTTSWSPMVTLCMPWAGMMGQSWTPWRGGPRARAGLAWRTCPTATTGEGVTLPYPCVLPNECSPDSALWLTSWMTVSTWSRVPAAPPAGGSSADITKCLSTPGEIVALLMRKPMWEWTLDTLFDHNNIDLPEISI